MVENQRQLVSLVRRAARCSLILSATSLALMASASAAGAAAVEVTAAGPAVSSSAKALADEAKGLAAEENTTVGAAVRQLEWQHRAARFAMQARESMPTTFEAPGSIRVGSASGSSKPDRTR